MSHVIITPVAAAIPYDDSIQGAISGASDVQTILDYLKHAQKIITGDYTLLSSDNNSTILVNNLAVNISITIPAGLPNLFSTNFIQQGTGRVAFISSGTTLNSISKTYRIKGQLSNAYIEQVGSTNVYQGLYMVEIITDPFNRGSSKPYLLFSSSGAVDASGVNTFTPLGTDPIEVGSNLGVVSGFPMTVVIHNADFVSSSVAAYLPVLFNNVMIMAITNAIHAPAFGTGETLLPGVYSIAGAASIGGTLYLDAQGNPDSIFVFQVAGAFAIGAVASVVLLNGALASHVFIACSGAFSIGAGSIYRGLALTSAGAISVGAGCTVEGSLMTQVGAIAITGGSFILA